MIRCPDCRKPISDCAAACPSCGLILTTDAVALEKAGEQRAKCMRDFCFLLCVVAAVPVFLLIGVLGTSSPSHPTVHTPSLAPTRSSTSDYAADAARQMELGEKRYPTRRELREYLIPDARQAVREGSTSDADYERWTGEAFPQ